MKKQIFMLLMAMVMVLGMSFASMADEAIYYEGVGTVDRQHVNSDVGEQEVLNPTLQIDGELYRIKFTGAEDQLDYDMFFKYSYDLYEHTYISLEKILINGEEVAQSYKGYRISLNQTGDIVEIGDKISGSDFYISIVITFTKITTSETHQIAAPVTGSTTSNGGNYIVTVAGYLTAELTNGTHTLSASDIASQNITVVVVNTSTGAVNVLNQSSIDGIIVTVSGGSATEFVISGSAQTAGGSSDTYTVTINP